MRLLIAVRAAFCAALEDVDAVASALFDAEDPVAFAAQLLRDSASSEDADSSTVCAIDVIASLPRTASFVDQLATFIVAWSTGERCPLLDQSPAADGVSVLTTSRDAIVNLPLSAVQGFTASCLAVDAEEEPASHADVVSRTVGFIQTLGHARGLLTCLGFRETVGSRTVAPLTRTQCLASFQQLQSSKEKLTVGARAFTKHCGRSTDGFWGSFKGNDRAKNATALAKLEQILDHAVWKNVHSLPHGDAAFEVRNAQGYGARWYVCDESFRGFLEPHMANGHENRWRH